MLLTVRDREARKIGAGPTPRTVPSPSLRRLTAARFRWTDAVLPIALLAWAKSAREVDPDAMNDWGLLAALPVGFFVAMGLLLVSIALVLSRARASPIRLGLHLIALIVFLQGTVPLIVRIPNYPWAYKHIGVTSYILREGSLDTSIDLYHNWPGFFGVAAWFTKIAGVHSPLAYAAWAPIYFNLLATLELSFALRCLAVAPRARWLALFIFVAANWVGQDYFAPQALAFVLSLGVFGIVLAWLRARRPGTVLEIARRLRGLLRTAGESILELPDGRPSAEWSRVATLGVLFSAFGVAVVMHQLTPYMVILGVGLLTAAGFVRPRWVVIAMATIAVAYLLAHLSSLPPGSLIDLKDSDDLLTFLVHPLGSVRDTPYAGSRAAVGRRVTALGAPLLMLYVWGLGLAGFVRAASQRGALACALLAVAPALLLTGQSYGGEAVFRAYLFSLPWTAMLAALAFTPRGRPEAVSATPKLLVALSVAVTLCMSAFYGSEELYRVRPGELRASQFFYDNARPGSVLALAVPSFPRKVGARYDLFEPPTPHLLFEVKELRHRRLGQRDVPEVSRFVAQYADAGQRYLALSTGQEVHAEVTGLLPRGSLASLGRALEHSTAWRVFYRNRDATIFQALPARDASFPLPSPAQAPARTLMNRLLAAAIFGAAVVGLLALFRARWRRLTMRRATLVTDGGIPLELLGNGDSSEQMERRRPVMTSTQMDRHEPSVTGGVAPPVGPAGDQPIWSSDAAPMPAARVLPWKDPSGPGRAAAIEALVVTDAHMPELLGMARDDLFAEVRVAALRALAWAGDEDQLAAMRSALADPDPEVRTAGVSLPVARSPMATDALLAALDDEHDGVRRAAARCLGAGQDWIVWMALQSSSRVQELCAILEEDEPGRLADVIQPRLSSPAPDDRILGLEIARHAPMAGAIPAAVAATQDPDPRVRRAAIGTLTGCAEALPALVRALSDPDAVVRLGAVGATAALERDDAFFALISSLHDPDVRVRGEVIDALARSPSPRLAHELAERLTESNIGSIGEALLRLGSVGEDALVSALRSGVSDRATAAGLVLRSRGGAARLRDGLDSLDGSVRLQTVESLGVLGGPDAVDGLIGALADPWAPVRCRAAFSLGQIDDDRCTRLLQEALTNEQDPDVRDAVSAALRVRTPS